jgi:hypothetical protein
MTPGRTWVNFMLPFKALVVPRRVELPSPFRSASTSSWCVCQFHHRTVSYGKVNVEFPGLNPNVYGHGESPKFVNRISLRASAILVAPVRVELTCTG